MERININLLVAIFVSYQKYFKFIMENYFKNRRTVRKYSDKPVSDELLNKILEESMRAPTTGNMQLYSVVVTRDPERKKLLSPAHFNQPSITGCSVVLTFCADFNRFIKWCDLNKAVPGYDNFQSFVTAVLDVVVLTQQFNTIAEMNGLGCCYIGTTTYNTPQIAEILDLPKYVIPVTTLTVGYPAGKIEDIPQVERLTLDAFIHSEKYTDYSPERINEIYRDKESLEVNSGYVKENNKETLAQVFTDVRYTKANNEHFSKVLYDFIEAQGFRFPE